MWKFFRTDGSEKRITDAALATLPTVKDTLAADVAISSGGTFYDAVSVDLTPGTWLLVGRICIKTDGAVGQFVAQLWDGTTAIASGQMTIATGGFTDVVPVSSIVTIDSNKTYKIRAAGTTNGQMLAATPNYDSGDQATELIAIMLSPPTVMPFYAGAVNLVTLSEFANLTPVDGMTVSVLVDATAGTVWTFRYNAGSASDYKWEFLGGRNLRDEVEASQTLTHTNQNTWYDLPNPVSLVVPRDGEYITRWGVRSYWMSGGYANKWGPKYGAAAMVNSECMAIDFSSNDGHYADSEVKELTKDAVIKTQSTCSVGTGQATWIGTMLELQPVRIS